MNEPAASPAFPPGDAAFSSFWMGGFEGADHLNGRGAALDMVSSNGHLARLDEDYAAAAERGIRTVRESIGWRIAEPAPGRFDLARMHLVASAARRHGVQVVWTLMHYGVPPDVRFDDDRFIERFVRFAETVARQLADAPIAPVYNLVNEISFLAWAVSETNLIWPYRSDPGNGVERDDVSGYAVKRRLVSAVLAAIDAIRRVDPRARFLHVEPAVHLVAPPGRDDLLPLAAEVSAYQWQVWDMIEGRAAPELGGHASALDVVGVNYYHDGQWEVETERRLDWHFGDPRRKPLGEALVEIADRYRRPLLLSETSHVGVGRAAWLDEVLGEVRRALRLGASIEGVCLYPLVDRPDWEDPTHWHHSGLWDVLLDETADAPFERRLCRGYADMLAAWQAAWPGTPPGACA